MREHNVFGPYVDGLSRLAVAGYKVIWALWCFITFYWQGRQVISSGTRPLFLFVTYDSQDIESLMSEGNKSRTVAATNMNEESSRSHAVFNVILTHTLMDIQSGVSTITTSLKSTSDLDFFKINLYN